MAHQGRIVNVALPYALNDSRAYAPDMGTTEIEQPLTSRLENIYSRLLQMNRMVEELQHGPQPEPSTNQLPPPLVGVLNLASECDKVSLVLENGIMIVAKRIGRL